MFNEITSMLKGLNNMELISLYSKIIKEMKEREIVRSKNITGDMGEWLVVNNFCNIIELQNLKLAQKSTKGYDATDDKNNKYSIKTITGKSTSCIRAKSEEKIFDVLNILILDDNYEAKCLLKLTWEDFIENRKWHSTMEAFQMSLNKKLIKKFTIWSKK